MSSTSRRGKGWNNSKDKSKKGNPKPLRRMETREIGLKTIPGQVEEKSTIVQGLNIHVRANLDIQVYT